MLLPGFVNCHSHAFQRALRGKSDEGGGCFWKWREQMYRLVTHMKDGEFKRVCRRCFDEMRDAGITTVGEFHYFHHGVDVESDPSERFKYDHLVLEAARESGIRIVLLEAFYCYAGIGDSSLSPAQKRYFTPSVSDFKTHIKNLRLQSEDHATQSGVLGNARDVFSIYFSRCPDFRDDSPR